jgi:chromosome segregation ATPase
MSLTCPACESVLSDDGKTLEQRSARLVELEKKAGRYDRELKALRAEIESLKAPKEKPKHEPKEKQTEPKPARPEPPADLSPYARQKWEREHGGGR